MPGRLVITSAFAAFTSAAITYSAPIVLSLMQFPLYDAAPPLRAGPSLPTLQLLGFAEAFLFPSSLIAIACSWALYWSGLKRYTPVCPLIPFGYFLVFAARLLFQ